MMRLLLSSLFLPPLFFTAVFAEQAQAPPPSDLSQYCFYALYGPLTTLSWGHSEAPRSQTPSPGCSNRITVTSIYASSKTYCSPSQLQAGLEYWAGLCQQSRSPLIDLSAIAANITDSYISQLPHVDPQSNSTIAISQPAVLSRTFFAISYQSWVRRSQPECSYKASLADH